MKTQYKIVIMTIAVLFFRVIPVLGQAIYVYYPSTTRPSVTQQQLRIIFGDNVKLMVFGRFHDFKGKIDTDNPDIIISKPQVLRDVSNFRVRMNGLRKGSTVESWVLVSVDKGISLDSVPTIVIGTIGFLERVNTERFVTKLLRSPVHLNRVMKIEDLLPILTFNKADAIFISEETVSYFKKTTQLNLVVTTVPACSTGIITCATRESGYNTTIGALLDTIAIKTIELLEIDQWKPVRY